MKKTFTSLLLALIALGAHAQSSLRNLESAKQLKTFAAVYSELERNFVDTLDTKKLFKNVIGYMLYQMDPYCTFYTEEETDDLKQMTTGKYGGIGSIISFHKEQKRCIISEPYADMPAAKAGLRRGDVIMAIDGKDLPQAPDSKVAQYNDSVSQCLRGVPGTKVKVTVKRIGEKELLHFDIERSTITTPSINYTTLTPDSIAYISLGGFTEHTARDMREILQKYEQRGMQGLVIDLRDNGGGLMSEAIEIANFFLPLGKEAVALRGKDPEGNKVYYTKSQPLNEKVPIVVMVNKSSASASEIVAGVLQDYDRAVIMGQNTYGKGLVQTSKRMPYETILKYTQSKYYIPSGRCVQAYKYNDGSPEILPDSLAKTFYTQNGRPVSDCGGIRPDIILPEDSLPNLMTYLSASNLIDDYVALYRSKHKTIAPAHEFRLTDQEYDEFTAYLKEKNFTYDQQTIKMLEVLRKMAQFEGYGETSKAEFDALEAKLKHNEDYDYKYWKDKIRLLVEEAIIIDYYYQQGGFAHYFHTDKDCHKAIDLLKNKEEYRRLLTPPAKKKGNKSSKEH